MEDAEPGIAEVNEPCSLPLETSCRVGCSPVLAILVIISWALHLVLKFMQTELSNLDVRGCCMQKVGDLLTGL